MALRSWKVVCDRNREYTLAADPNDGTTVMKLYMDQKTAELIASKLNAVYGDFGWRAMEAP